MHSRESNYSSLSNYFVSAKKRKREWNNGILKFVYLYIYSKNPLWLRIISRVKQRFSKVVKLYLLQSKKKKKSCETRTIRSNEVNRKPFTKTVLLTSKTGICEKLNEPFEPQFNLTDLKTVDSCGSPRFSWFRVFFFFFFLGTYRLSHWWSFNLRHWDRNTICSYSSFQSRSQSLFAFFADCYFCIFSFFAFFSFVVSAIFCLPVFFLWSLESSGLFEDDWQFMSLIKTIPNFLNYDKR